VKFGARCSRSCSAKSKCLVLVFSRCSSTEHWVITFQALKCYTKVFILLNYNSIRM
jgi:hypothetical protein